MIKKLIVSCSLFFTAISSLSMANEQSENIDALPYLVTSGESDNDIYANAGENLRTGVGSIYVRFVSTAPGGFICTASVISNQHILTAAHCLRNAGDTLLDLAFVLSAGQDEPLILEAESFAVYPFYDALVPIMGAIAHGDIAVVKLTEPLPENVEIYELYREFDEFYKTTRHYGHGSSGKGNKGAVNEPDFFYARTGLNQYEQVLEPLIGTGINDQLLHDFDSGGRKHNAMEWWFSGNFFCIGSGDKHCTSKKDGSYPDFKGFGKLEVGIGPGDSGGPGFIDGKIAGVHSFGFTHGCDGIISGADFNCELDSTFGEMSGDTRVSMYQIWIDYIVNGLLPSTPIPEPSLSITQITDQSTVTESVELSDDAKAFITQVKTRHLKAEF